MKLSRPLIALIRVALQSLLLVVLAQLASLTPAHAQIATSVTLSCGGYRTAGLSDAQGASYATGYDCQGLLPQTITMDFGIVLSGGRVSWWTGWSYGTMTNSSSIAPPCSNPPIVVQFPEAMEQVRITIGSLIAQDVTVTTNLGTSQTVNFGTYGYRNAEFFGLGITSVSITSNGRGFFIGNTDFIPDSCEILNDEGSDNAGQTSCNAHVGAPINVTNGNMYLQQTDYQLPGVGPAISITRTYNSVSPGNGLFGRGWSSDYDEKIKFYNPTNLRWFRADGQATSFTRASDSGPFTPVEGDFHGTLIQNADRSFTVSFTDGSVHRFNSTGKLLSQADRLGNQTSLSYDINGRLISITDPFGRALTITPDASGRVLSISDSLGAAANYSYGGSGELLSVSYPDSSGYRFSYNSNLLLASVTDALGNLLESHTYDTLGRALTSEKQGGVEHYGLSYISDTETDVTDALGHVSKYFFDKSKGRNLVTQIQGLCSCGTGSQTQSWTYDSQLNVASHTNALGQVATYTYDTRGTELSGTGVLGTSTFTYNQFSEVLTATDAMGGVTTNTYDAAGNLLSVKDALNNTTTFTYDARGQLLTMTDALGKVMTLAYDASGNITQATDAAGGSTRFAYDARGRLVSATDALNFVTSYAYDTAGRLNKITRPDATFVTFTYDLAGRRTKVTDALNNSTMFAYDGAYRLTSATDALGKSVNYGYDLGSNLIAATDQLGRVTNVDYDEFNRPKTITYPPATTGATRLQETIEYDVAGNVTKRTDTAGRATTFEYDNANRVVKVTDPALQVTQLEYNPRSNVTAVVDALNQRYTFDYDALGRVTATARAGLQMTYAYDAVGNRIQRTDFNNMTTSYGFDALNRLTKITYPDATTATYGYDKLSELTAATNVSGAVSLTYDKLRRVTSTTDVWGQVINYAYDANGNRTKMSFGATTAATYAYDASNRLTTISDGSGSAIDYAFDATSKLVSRTLPNGIVTSATYDGLDRLTRLQDTKNKKVVADNNYQYNAAGDIVQNTDLGGTHAYGYDTVDRLTSASYPGSATESYAYDGAGNRTSSQRALAYGYQPFNRLVSSSTASYIYDNNGNLTAKSENAGTTHLQWDFENRLVQVVTPASGSVTYKYDALGRRIQRMPANGVGTDFSYDGEDVVKDFNSDGTAIDYLNGPGVDNKIRQSSTVRHKTTALYYATDHLGSTTVLTNDQGHVVDNLAYDAYGNSAGSANTRYDYTGRERDSVTGLLYYRARWYDPQVGRFISEDPIGLAGGINSFAYVGNNPPNGKDPSGLYEIDVHYYLTYFLAKKTGCFTDAEARLVADADQGTDENPDTLPGPGLTPKQQQQNQDYHDLRPENYEGVGSPELWRQAMNGPTNYVGLGRYLHYLQDSFSHAGYESDSYGHSLALHYPDKTASDVPKALRMAGATWKALNEYAKAKKCDCHGSWDPSWWQRVVEFSREHGSNFDALETIDSNGEIENFGMTNNRLYLLRKIRILGLSPR